MRILLDTRVWLWMLTAPARLPPGIRSALSSRANSLFLSVASAWEISIKYQLGRLELPEPPRKFIAPRLLRDGVASLPVELHHATHVANLPNPIAIRSTACSSHKRRSSGSTWPPSTRCSIAIRFG